MGVASASGIEIFENMPADYASFAAGSTVGYEATGRSRSGSPAAFRAPMALSAESAFRDRTLAHPG